MQGLKTEAGRLLTSLKDVRLMDDELANQDDGLMTEAHALLEGLTTGEIEIEPMTEDEALRAIRSMPSVVDEYGL